MTWLSLSLRLAARCVAHPSIAPDLVVIAWRFRERGWFRHFPFLPLPAQEYVRWRMHTAYGNHHAVPPVDDVIRYARWARRANRTG